MKVKNKNKNISSKQDQFRKGHLEVQNVLRLLITEDIPVGTY